MGAPSFVGRARERAALEILLEEAERGRGGAALVEGEAGIGKSRLLEEFLAAADGRLRVLTGRAEELERDRPFGLLSELTGAVASEIQAEVEVAAARFRVMDSILDVVEEWTAERPLVLALEDVHWADASSIVTLNRLARRTGQMPLLLILTARPSPRPEELSRLVETLGDMGATRVRLGPLDDGDVRELVRDIVRAPPRPELLEQVRRAAGNPLFITEFLGARTNDASVSQPDADLAGSAELPPTVRLAILHRLRYLPKEVLDTLRMAAVLGSTFSVSDLSSVTGRTALQLSSDLRPALEAGVVGEQGDRLAFRHDLVRDAVYYDLPLAMRTALHRQTAGALASSGSSASQVAAHMSLGAERGDRDAVNWLRKAAAEVAGRDPGVAAEHLHKALALMEEGDPERPEVMLALARCLIWTSHFEVAIGILEEALGLADPDDKWKVLFSLNRVLNFVGRPEEAIRRLDDWHGNGTPEQRALFAAARAHSRSFTGDFDRALTEARDAVALAEQEDVPGAVMLGLLAMTILSYLRGELLAAIDHGQRYDALHAENSGPVTSWHPRVAHLGSQQSNAAYALALFDADRPVEAHEALRQDLRLYEATGNIKFLPFAHHSIAVERFFTGRWDDAVAESEAGMALGQELDISYGRALGAVVFGSIAVHRDDLDAAGRYCAVADGDVAAGHAAPYEVFLLPWLKGMVAELDGDPAAALSHFDSYWAPLQSFGLLSLARFGALDYCRALVAAGRTADARAVADLMDEVAERSGHVASATAKALHCRGLADNDSEVLLQAVERYRATPRRVELAEGCFDAGSGLASGRVEEGVALLREAIEIFESVGARRDVRKVTARLRELGMSSGGRGRRRRPSVGWESLTPSETEVVARLCQGMTNRRIADSLYISPRTVESHLGHVFQKLGLASRAELLATALPRLTSGAHSG